MNHVPTIASELEEGILVQTAPATPTVDRIMGRFSTMWRTTADLCRLRADELEKAAYDLRMRADKLDAAMELTAEVKGAVQFEIEARQRANSLALVNPSAEN
jgi:hypothetical protein